ncbi:hypothetical protein DEU56DRAFT_915715 [Suillus clintonianus]|uniref:uncharacterized protein n=1 Tax=Suillus clintonianus TaxID=1904413 RepID=UPI001B868F4B|nr:uncharacterized protein DEU56DRAFT_915715 [Suillus clintonianus]KAG2127502.1 hypothetical protein DEU56DRAFT_915715 [Suillus clintonianus]
MSSSSDSSASGEPPMTTTSSLKLPGATSFDTYLCGASLSSAGFPPVGGRTVNTVKGLLRAELDGHVIDESGLAQMKFTDSIFRALIPVSTFQNHHVKKIRYHKKDGASVYIQNKWNYSRRKKSKGSGRDTTDTDIVDSDDLRAELEALDSHGSTIFSQGTDSGSDNEFNGSVKAGSKRKQKKSSTERDLQYLFHAVQWALRNRTGYAKKLPYEISPIERYWSAEFANSPIPDLYNSQKPDVALFYYMNKREEKRWVDVLSFVEHTSSNFVASPDLSVYCGSTTKVYLIMREQPPHHIPSDPHPYTPDQCGRLEADDDKDYLQAVYKDECEILHSISAQTDQVAKILDRRIAQCLSQSTGCFPLRRRFLSGVQTTEPFSLEDSDVTSDESDEMRGGNLGTSDFAFDESGSEGLDD